MRLFLRTFSIVMLCGILTCPMIEARGRNNGGNNEPQRTQQSKGTQNSQGTQNSRGGQSNRGVQPGKGQNKTQVNKSNMQQAQRQHVQKSNVSINQGNQRPGNSGVNQGNQRPGNGGNSNSGINQGNQRPGNSGWGNNNPGNNNTQRPNNGNNHNGGQGGNNKPNQNGGNHNNGNHNNGGNHNGGNHNGGHPGNNGNHNGGYPGNNGNHNGGHPGNNGNHYGHQNHPGVHYGVPHRPMMPPHPRPYAVPRPPYGWVYNGGGPLINTILGVTLGTAINATLNLLINQGYNVIGYVDDAIYVTDAMQLNLLWPNATLYYGPYGGLMVSEFYYSTPYYDMNRYNMAYNRLYNAYGPPISSVGLAGGGIQTTWWGANGSYVQLQFQGGVASNGQSRFYTTLSFGN